MKEVAGEHRSPRSHDAVAAWWCRSDQLRGVPTRPLSVAFHHRDELEIGGANAPCVASHFAQVLRSCLRQRPCFGDAAEYREQCRPSEVERSRRAALAHLLE